MPMKALLFDLDGTLLDTLDDLADAANRILIADGLPTHDRNAYRDFIGDGARMLITRALPEDRRTPESIEGYLTRFKADYSRNWKTATRAYPGIMELLQELMRRHIPRAVVTNKPHVFAEHCIRHFFPDTPFGYIRGQKNNLPLKPNPSPALETAAHLHTPAEECILLGDSGVDMETANRAAMLAVGAEWGFRSIDELHQAGAAHIIKHPLDILPYFEGDPST